MISTKEPVCFDLELMGRGAEIYFMFGAYHLPSGKKIKIEGNSPESLDKLHGLLRNPKYVWVSFNGIKFDAPVLSAVMQGRDLADVKRMANEIITDRKPAWMAARDYQLEPLDIDHIDLMETAPGVMISLKLYAARLGLKSIVDLPFEHDAILDEKQREMVADYCLNGDLVATAALFEELQGEIELREKMGAEYGLDLRSKSGAQVAAAIISNQLGLKTIPPIPSSVRYKAPPFIQPRHPLLIEKLERIHRHEFKIDKSSGAVEFPPFLEEPIKIGTGVYQMGIGGLHSKHDRCQDWVSTDTFKLENWDAASYYPSLILAAGLIPRNLGLSFLNLYRNILDRRLAAKRSGDKGVANSLKLVANSTFGLFGSKFSKLYSPDLMLAVTLTGQLYLLSLIDDLVQMGVRVISANTDGILIGGHPNELKAAREFIESYAWLTGFEFECDNLARYSCKDVNNFVSVDVKGGIKAKGIYAAAGLQKNPTNEVCTLAAQAFLAHGTPIDTFIREHLKPENFADFTQSRSVTGGAVAYTAVKEVDDWINLERGAWYRQAWYDMGKVRKPLKRVSRPDPVMSGDNPVFLGRIARWHYSTHKDRSIHYFNNDNQVPKASGATACLKLPDAIPDDLDVDRYIEETKTNLRNMGCAI